MKTYRGSQRQPAPETILNPRTRSWPDVTGDMSYELEDATWMTNRGTGPFLLSPLLCAFPRLLRGTGRGSSSRLPQPDCILELPFLGKVLDHASERASRGLSMWPTSQDTDCWKRSCQPGQRAILRSREKAVSPPHLPRARAHWP